VTLLKKPRAYGFAQAFVLLFLTVSAIVYGLETGVMPGKGSVSVERFPVFYWAKAGIYIAIACLVAIITFSYVQDWVHSLFSRYGGSYNWSTLKAIIRGSRK
jgi:hypothetical protein